MKRLLVKAATLALLFVLLLIPKGLGEEQGSFRPRPGPPPWRILVANSSEYWLLEPGGEIFCLERQTYKEED